MNTEPWVRAEHPGRAKANLVELGHPGPCARLLGRGSEEGGRVAPDLS